MRILGMSPGLFMIVVLLFILAIIPARIARGKGHSYAGFYLFGLLLFLPAFVVALCIKPYAASDPSQDLLNYKRLLDDGAITQEEYDQKKRELLKTEQSCAAPKHQ